jgi:hypothetical protein
MRTGGAEVARENDFRIVQRTNFLDKTSPAGTAEAILEDLQGPLRDWIRLFRLGADALEATERDCFAVTFYGKSAS